MAEPLENYNEQTHDAAVKARQLIAALVAWLSGHRTHGEVVQTTAAYLTAMGDLWVYESYPAEATSLSKPDFNNAPEDDVKFRGGE